MNTLTRVPRSAAAEVRLNVLSGLVVALAMVPEAIAFALVAGVAPLVGLYAAFVMGFVTSVFGGRPGMISGATGATAVVMTSLVAKHGVEYVFAAVVLTGALQITFARLGWARFIALVSRPVMLGFVNGLSLVIFSAQFAHFRVTGADGVGRWLPVDQLYVAGALIGLTMVLIYLIPRFTRAVPAGLVAIVVVTAVQIIFKIDQRTVGDLGGVAGGWPRPHWPAVPFDLTTLGVVLPYALVLAFIGLLESLLTLNLIDEVTHTRGRPDRECLAQGAANILAGLFGGMGGCAMIGQSMINVGNGATQRASGVAASLFLLSFIVFASRPIELVPLAALIGVMFVVCEKTFDWNSLKTLFRIPRADAVVIVLVTVVTVFTNLGVAVLVGVSINALAFAWAVRSDVTTTITRPDEDTKVYAVAGTLYFASVGTFAELFTPLMDPRCVTIDLGRARVMDHSARAAIEALRDRYAFLGKTLTISKDARISSANDWGIRTTRGIPVRSRGV